jgi:predicted PurR-regulated permease PerM
MQTPKAQTVLFFAIMLIVTIAFFYIMKPFVYAVFWAVVLAGLFMPVYKKVQKKLHRPTVSAAIVLILICLIFILPFVFIASLLLKESMDIYQGLSKDNSQINVYVQKLAALIKHNPYTDSLHLDDAALTEKITELSKSVTGYIFENLKSFTQNTLQFIVQLGVMLYALFYFIRDGQKFLNSILRFLPLGQGRDRILLGHFRKTANSTLKVTLIIGGIQGILGGLLFLFTGIQGAILWGVVMIITAVIPVVGCALVWAPAGVFMMIAGHFWTGILILAFGALVISMVDHFLRPILLGKDVSMHPLFIFLSTMGGIIVFGFTGFIIGPIIMSLAMAVWQMYEDYYLKEIV